MMRVTLGCVSVSLLCLGVGCGGSSGGGGGGGGTGTMSLSATDAPIDHTMVDEAVIRVDKIRVHPEADAEGGFITLYDGDPIELNLLELHNGITAELVTADVPAATYRQIRLHVESARLRLVNGNVYDTEDGSLHLTSQDTSGFKVFIDPPVAVISGFSTELLLDVDLSKTFLPIPADDPLEADTYSLHPVIRVANLSTSGEIRGVVGTDDESGGVVPRADATVYILPPGETDTANSIASTATEADGEYAVLGLPAGTYDVLATQADLEGRVDGVTVSVGSVTVVDITLH
jgi:hypothetical protein